MKKLFTNMIAIYFALILGVVLINEAMALIGRYSVPILIFVAVSIIAMLGPRIYKRLKDSGHLEP